MLEQALARREELRSRLWLEGTDCYRIFHGVAEGRPGITVDRYGSLLLLQTFRDPLSPGEAHAIADTIRDLLGEALEFVWNHRGRGTPPGEMGTASARALAERTCRENEARFLIRARHRGQDPWLFLDMRSGRRLLQQIARGKTMLNLFAYTCTAGIASALAGAREVVNVDFSESALQIGRGNAAINSIDKKTFKVLHSDCIPILRQIAGKPVQRRERNHPYVVFPQREFDVIFLDPPRFSKGPFGAVDVVRDYPSLFKPALLALSGGGTILATNHVPGVDAKTWIDSLRRCAAKAGRPLASVELIGPDADFPSFDGAPPLKIALCRVP